SPWPAILHPNRRPSLQIHRAPRTHTPLRTPAHQSQFRSLNKAPHSALDQATFPSKGSEGAFTLFAAGQAAPLAVSSSDYAGVLRAAEDLQTDIEKVSGVAPSLANDVPQGAAAVLIGTLGNSALIDQLVTDGKLDAGE